MLGQLYADALLLCTSSLFFDQTPFLGAAFPFPVLVRRSVGVSHDQRGQEA
jgi:hypothetical protein